MSYALTARRSRGGFSGYTGLGALLPTITGQALNAPLLQQYDALAAGTTAGGNFQHFQDAASLGWFTNDSAGYANYLAYNNLGLGDAAFRQHPDLVGWWLASTGAYAVVNRMHQGNAESPVWTPEAWVPTALQSIQGVATNVGWTPEQRAEADASFSSHFPRLLAKWRYTGAPVAVVIEPTIRNQVTGVDVPKSQVLFYGELPDGQIELRTTQGTWRWAGPNYREPPPLLAWTGKVALDFVLVDNAFEAGLGYPVYAMRQLNYMNDGSIIGQWQGWSAWTTEEALRRSYGETIQKYGSTLRVRFLSELSSVEVADITQRTGGSPVVPMVPSTPSLPQPPPGSTLYVPASGSGQEPTIQLPGTTEFVPVSSVPPSAFVPTQQVSTLPPPVIIMTARDGAVREVSPESVGLSPARAGMGGVGTIALLAGLALLLVPGKRARSRR